MTRINLVDITKLSDQHLIAEYRELPRIINDWKKNRPHFYDGIPLKFCLGKGHVKFFRNKILFLLNRHKQLTDELLKRNFKIKINLELNNDLSTRLTQEVKLGIQQLLWIPNDNDILISQNRIDSKIQLKPTWYKWSTYT